MKTFSNMGTTDLILTAQSYELGIQTLTQTRHCLIKDDDYNRIHQLLTAKINRLKELKQAVMFEAALHSVPKIQEHC